MAFSFWPWREIEYHLYDCVDIAYLHTCNIGSILHKILIFGQTKGCFVPFLEGNKTQGVKLQLQRALLGTNQMQTASVIV